MEIVLSGVCRFEVDRELTSSDSYRSVVPDWTAFEIDYHDESVDPDRARMFYAMLEKYCLRNGLGTDWDELKPSHARQVANNLVMALPISASRKQALLESVTLDERLDLFVRVLSDTDLGDAALAGGERRELIRH